MHDAHDFIRKVILDFLIFTMQNEANHHALYTSPEFDLVRVRFPPFFVVVIWVVGCRKEPEEIKKNIVQCDCGKRSLPFRETLKGLFSAFFFQILGFGI